MSTIPLPDLLHRQKGPVADQAFLEELLGMAFLGSNETARIRKSLGEMPLADSTWNPALYASEIFLAEHVEGCSRIRIGERVYNAHTDFITRVIGQPPGDLETIRFRQDRVAVPGARVPAGPDQVGAYPT